MQETHTKWWHMWVNIISLCRQRHKTHTCSLQWSVSSEHTHAAALNPAWTHSNEHNITRHSKDWTGTLVKQINRPTRTKTSQLVALTSLRWGKTTLKPERHPRVFPQKAAALWMMCLIHNKCAIFRTRGVWGSGVSTFTIVMRLYCPGCCVRI